MAISISSRYTGCIIIQSAFIHNHHDSWVMVWAHFQPRLLNILRSLRLFALPTRCNRNIVQPLLSFGGSKNSMKIVWK